MTPSQGQFKHKFCPRPFASASIAEDGTMRFRPQSWQDIVPLDAAVAGVDQVWNSSRAQMVRNSILEGNFKYCSRLTCPSLQPGGGLLEGSEVSDPTYRMILDGKLASLPCGPKDLTLHYAAAGQKLLSDRPFPGEFRDVMQINIIEVEDRSGLPHFVADLAGFDWAKHLSLKLNLVTSGLKFTPQTW